MPKIKIDKHGWILTSIRIPKTIKRAFEQFVTDNEQDRETIVSELMDHYSQGHINLKRIKARHAKALN